MESTPAFWSGGELEICHGRRCWDKIMDNKTKTLGWENIPIVIGKGGEKDKEERKRNSQHEGGSALTNHENSKQRRRTFHPMFEVMCRQTVTHGLADTG